MKYYVVSDIHGFYSEFRSALTVSDFFDDTEPHKPVVLGDLFDRGHEANKLQSFILDLMDRDEIILIRGNHEDLFVELVTTDGGVTYKHHKHNGTYDTALQPTGMEPADSSIHRNSFPALDLPLLLAVIGFCVFSMSHPILILAVDSHREFILDRNRKYFCAGNELSVFAKGTL